MGTHLKPLIIEFVGLPGAGKTTVFDPVASYLKSQEISVVLRSEILEEWQAQPQFKKFLKLIPDNPNQLNILFQSLKLGTQVKPINLTSFSKAAKVFTNAKRLDSVSLCQAILMDQGLLQEIWSIGLTGTPPSIEHLQSSLFPLFESRKIAIVYFKIDIETALDRIQNRSTGRSRFDQISIESAKLLLLKYEPYLKDILTCAEKFGTPILEIDSERSIEEKTDKITHWLVNLIA